MAEVVRTIAVIANLEKSDAPALVGRLAAKADDLGAGLISCDETADLHSGIERVSARELAERADVLVAMGGDGTLLRAVHQLARHPVPLLGVNIGSLGFMTSILADDLERALDALVAGQYTLSDRSQLESRVMRGGKEISHYQTLNDVAIGWGENSRVIHLEVDVDDDIVTTYFCDGLIISTPTGSTGHSLSAGGPVLHPATPAMVLNPICPHTLSNRPLVLSDTSTIRVRVGAASKQLLLAADGQDLCILKQQDEIIIRRSETPARFIHLDDYSYFNVLRQKLHWRGSTA